MRQYNYMNKTVNSKIGLAALAVMLIFGVIASMPQNASANHGNFSGSYIGDRYGYDIYQNPVVVRPVYVSQPVYITQPVIIQQPVIVQQPVYVQPVIVQQYQPLTSSCSASVSYNTNGQATVVYTANPSGGNGFYSYYWTGTENFSGSYNRSTSKTYYTPGYKSASVTVNSNGYSITVNCAPVNITFPYNTYYQPVYQQPVYVNSNSLDVGCFVDPANAKVNQPINWTAEVTGGMAPYTYSWTGSDGLTGSQSSVIKYYGTTGSKSALVSITSADGKTATKACSNAITIASAYKAPVIAKVVKSNGSTVNTITTTTTTTTKTTASNQDSKPAVTDNSTNVSANNSTPSNSNVTASSILSLGNVPWGWVSVIMILVLFFTVMYLLFNRKKI